MAQEYRLLAFLDGEVHVVEQYRAVGINGLQTLHFQNLGTRLTLHSKDDAGILAR